MVVQPKGTAVSISQYATRVLEYRFVDQLPAHGLSALAEDDTGVILTLSVETAGSSAVGDFREHVLSRVFAKELLRCRPRCVVIRAAHGCSLDLIRVAHLLQVPAFLDLSIVGESQPDMSPWLLDCLRLANVVFHNGAHSDFLTQLQPCARWASINEISVFLDDFDGDRPESENMAAPASQQDGLDYALYEFVQRDHPLLMRMQQGDVGRFSGCHRVLDLGCGAGLFLQLLGEAGIPATGVERNPVIAEYGRGMGLDIITADALEFLEGEDARFDGIYCSHFVEHLPIDGVERLLQGIARVLLPGGVAVLVFPDPESIRSQLLGFWRDPEHVRFYHPELVETLAMLFGLELEWSSYDAQPHEVGPFALEPQPLPRAEAQPLPSVEPAASQQGWWCRAMTSLGFVPRSRVAELEGRLANMESLLTRVMQDNSQTVAALDERTRQLWAVNRTWAWSDNAVLKLRKRPLPETENP